MAATYADEFNIGFCTPERAQEAFGRVHEACEKRGRDASELQYSVALATICGENDADLARRAAAIGREVGELRENGLCGTPAEIIERVEAYKEVGATRLYTQMVDTSDVEHVTLVGESIIEAVR